MGYTHGVSWNDELIEINIKEVMNALDIKRMPSNSEIKMVMNECSLGNAISRRGGFKVWAEKLGLENKISDTTFGNEYEFIVKELIEELGYDVEKMTYKHPYDLLVNDNIKIDVKVSRYYHKESFKYHTFNLEKKYHNCDMFICIGINEDDEIEKCLVIPSKYIMNIKQFSVGVNSNYDRFHNKWEYLEKYNNFYNEL